MLQRHLTALQIGEQPRGMYTGIYGLELVQRGLTPLRQAAAAVLLSQRRAMSMSSRKTLEISPTTIHYTRKQAATHGG